MPYPRISPHFPPVFPRFSPFFPIFPHFPPFSPIFPIFPIFPWPKKDLETPGWETSKASEHVRLFNVRDLCTKRQHIQLVSQLTPAAPHHW